MKNYYSCIDTAFVKYVPQPLQHLAIARMAEGIGGKVVFYTSEDFRTLASQGSIRSKILQKGETVSGVIFFTLKQFLYGEKPNFRFLKFILDEGFEVHFTRENLSLTDHEALDQLFPILYATHYVTKGKIQNGYRELTSDIGSKHNDKILLPL
jgi:hypothetical protein